MIEGSYCNFCYQAVEDYSNAGNACQGNEYQEFLWSEASLNPCDFCSHYNSIICPDVVSMIIRNFKGY